MPSMYTLVDNVPLPSLPLRLWLHLIVIYVPHCLSDSLMTHIDILSFSTVYSWFGQSSV